MVSAKPSSVSELEQAFELFNRVSNELGDSYRDLESKVAGLTAELTAARSARVRELAEKERLAHRLSSLVSVLPGGVLIVGADQVIRDVNPEALGLLGEPLVGLCFEDVLSRVAVGVNTMPSPEKQLKSGKRISIVSRQLDSAGDHVVLITDVSENHKLREQLEQRKRLSAMGEMAARLAHQIRTPLSSATLYLSQLGRQDLAREDRTKVSSRLGERLGHISNLVDSMLSFVRGAAPACELVYLAEVLATFEANVRPLLAKSGATLALPSVDNTLGVVGDRDELAGALCNLAMNAIEASPDPVALDVWVGALNRDCLQIRVSDNGPGIAQEIIDRVFDPFFTTRIQGTGLGLAVVAGTVSQHGGDISVQNRATGGAEFLISLPIATDRLATAPVQPEHSQKVAQS